MSTQTPPSTPWSISPQELVDKNQAKAPIQLVDVREREEVQIASLGGIWIPLGDFARRFEELDPELETVVYCHHGVRSGQAVGFLRQRGYDHARNLSGGIDRWSVEIDPSLPRY